MTENHNVCKTIRQEIYAVYYDIKCTSAVTCEWALVVLSRKAVYFGISKRVLYFHIVFLPHALYFLLFNFTLYFPYFAFLLLIALDTLLVKRFSFAFIKVQSSVSQKYIKRLKMRNNIPRVTQYALSLKTIVLFCEVFLEGGALKM